MKMVESQKRGGRIRRRSGLRNLHFTERLVLLPGFLPKGQIINLVKFRETGSENLVEALV
jgi:hypothetical protein